MSNKSITDIRVVQKMGWVEQEDGTKRTMPISYVIQTQREGSDNWEDINVVFDNSALEEQSP